MFLSFSLLIQLSQVNEYTSQPEISRQVWSIYLLDFCIFHVFRDPKDIVSDSSCLQFFVNLIYNFSTWPDRTIELVMPVPRERLSKIVLLALPYFFIFAYLTLTKNILARQFLNLFISSHLCQLILGWRDYIYCPRLTIPSYSNNWGLALQNFQLRND